MDGARPVLAVIGNPGGRRIRLFQESLRKRGLPAARVVAYRDLLAGQPLARFVPLGATIRIDSPGESFEVERALLRAGAAAAHAERAPTLSPAEVDVLALDKGRIRHPRQWYLGYCALLDELEVQGMALQANWTTHPREVALMFDKRAAQTRLAARGVAVPESLGGIRDYETLLGRMREHGMRRAFIKLAHGSSASGVMALHDSEGGMHALTTVELADRSAWPALYNSLRLRTYRSERDIALMVNALCAEGVQAERWLPKAAGPAGNFDLRILVVAGRARLQVMRVNRSPMTNLHLGSMRGDVAGLRRDMGEARWQDMLNVAERAAHAFPAALHVGVDLMLMPGLRRPHVLETNAFGDLLPGVIAGGLDAYGHQLAALYPQAHRSEAVI